MSLFDLVVGDDAVSAARMGALIQRSLGGLGVLIAIGMGAADHGVAAFIVGGWSLGVVLAPFIFGRMVSVAIGVMCAMMILMGENGSGATFRVEAFFLSLPLLLVAGLLYSKHAAGAIAHIAINLFRSLFTKSAQAD